MGANLVLAHGKPVDQVGANSVAATRGVCDGDFAESGDSNLRLDDVLSPVALGGRDIAGQGVVFEGRERDVMRAADARLEHAAAPDRDGAFISRVVDGNSLGKAPDAAQLDVDDAA